MLAHRRPVAARDLKQPRVAWRQEIRVSLCLNADAPAQW